jgi:putative phage-type endonuclease
MGLFKKEQSAVTPPNIKNVTTEFPYYEINDLEQGTQDWLNWRKKVIGASDAPVIMGENRWKSKQFLMDEKMGLKAGFQGNAATREGHRLEGEARRLLERKYSVKISPTIVQDAELPFVAASLDGVTEGHSQVFEIKCGAKSYELAIKNEIPNYYFGQLQHILMVTQLDKIIYGAYRPYSKLIILELGRDDKYISRMRDTEQEFADLLIRNGHKMQQDFRGNLIER